MARELTEMRKRRFTFSSSLLSSSLCSRITSRFVPEGIRFDDEIKSICYELAVFREESEILVDQTCTVHGNEKEMSLRGVIGAYARRQKRRRAEKR